MYQSDPSRFEWRARAVNLVASLAVIIGYELRHSSWWGYTFRRDAEAFWETVSAHINAEVPVVLIALALAYAPRAQPAWLARVLPTCAVLGTYITFDHFSTSFARAPRISDLSNLPLLFEVDLPSAFALSVMVGAGIVAWLIVTVSELRRACVSALVRLSLITVIVMTLGSSAFQDSLLSRYQYVPWRELTTIRDNGRVASFLFYSYQERAQLRSLRDRAAKPLSYGETLYPGELYTAPPHIHIIVLESFVDPRLIRYRGRPLEMRPEPLAGPLKPHLLTPTQRAPLSAEADDAWGELGFSRVRSPVYGGGTAQAEFELLTGLPALARFNAIDFNVMRGKSTSSFIRHLRAQGYRSLATIATRSGYFNSTQAYQSLGLEEVVYLEEEPSFERDSSEPYLFDGDVFDYHLERLKRLKSKSAQEGPVISYLLGMYGHTPFRRDEERHPDLIEVSPHSETLTRVVNQFYYRTRALGRYLSALYELDPDAIVYVTSDHLPALFNQEVTYEDDLKQNIALLRSRDQVIDVSGRRLYEIPQLIWGLIARGSRAEPLNLETDAARLESIYAQTLADSVGLQ